VATPASANLIIAALTAWCLIFYALSRSPLSSDSCAIVLLEHSESAVVLFHDLTLGVYSGACVGTSLYSQSR
jgi:hypothetical protein